MNSTNLDTKLQLQRLVDGELSLSQTQQLLLAAESEPALWKKMASMFVEDQFLGRAFTAEDLASGNLSVRRASKARNNAMPQATRWMSLAASLALAVAVGFLVGSRPAAFDSPVDSTAVASLDSRSELATDNRADSTLVESSQPAVAASELTPAVYRMQVEDPDGNQFIDSELPFYPIRGERDLKMLKPPTVPDAWQQQARKSGYQLDQHVRYLSGRMNDGRRFVIPVRNYRLLPAQ